MEISKDVTLAYACAGSGCAAIELIVPRWALRSEFHETVFITTASFKHELAEHILNYRDLRFLLEVLFKTHPMERV